MGKFYTETFQIQNTDVDFCSRMKPSALLRCVEQVSADNARTEGHGEEYLCPRGLAMLVGRQALRFMRVPVRGETLTLVTRPEQSRHGSMKRITTATDEAGRLVALVDARWILVDTQKGRILREPTWDTTPFWAEKVEGELPQSVHRNGSAELKPLGMWKASYSLCDEHGHVNNSRYLDLACDALPLEALRQAPVTFAAIKYDHELLLDETMELFRAPSAAGWYVAGRKEGKNVFECYLELGDAHSITLRF